MIIGFDVDQTITRCPQFFAVMSDALVSAGHTVLIITFRVDRECTEHDLKEWGVRYSKLITYPPELVIDDDPDAWKAQVCRRHDVDVFVDDDPSVLMHMDDRTFCLLSVDPDRANLPEHKVMPWR